MALNNWPTASLCFIPPSIKAERADIPEAMIVLHMAIGKEQFCEEPVYTHARHTSPAQEAPKYSNRDMVSGMATSNYLAVDRCSFRYWSPSLRQCVMESAWIAEKS